MRKLIIPITMVLAMLTMAVGVGVYGVNYNSAETLKNDIIVETVGELGFEYNESGSYRYVDVNKLITEGKAGSYEEGDGSVVYYKK